MLGGKTIGHTLGVRSYLMHGKQILEVTGDADGEQHGAWHGLRRAIWLYLGHEAVWSISCLCLELGIVVKGSEARGVLWRGEILLDRSNNATMVSVVNHRAQQVGVSNP